LKNGEHLFSLHVLPGKVPSRLRLGVPRRISPRAILFIFFFLAFACLRATRSSAQSTSEHTDTIRGIVINGVTREPISRALVFSPDNRFATLTNSEGRFEFTLPKVDPATEGGSDSNGPVSGRQPGVSNRPYMLMARKPGFLADPNNPGQNFQNEALQDLTLALIPEALIVGTVTLPTSEAPDSITLQIFRRQVQDGSAHYFPAGTARSTSDGQFRFADLPSGTYKLLTHELLDRDPITSDPRNVDPLTNDPRGPLFGYPPVYYQSAPDFGSASTIQLAAGQTQTVNLSLAKEPYYHVKIPVIMPASAAQGDGVAVGLYANGRKGPGFSLGYNNLHHVIEGMLPNGTYTVEAMGLGPNGLTGLQTISIKGAPIDGPSMTLVPGTSIPVNVKEEFTSPDHTGSMTWGIKGRNVVIKGPRKYLSITLEPTDHANDFGLVRTVALRSPTGAADDALVLEGAQAGSYWVRVNSSRGYPASIRSGNLDLQHQPLVVGAGGAASPIEITMRDDTAEISGTVAGVTPPAQPPVTVNDGAQGRTSYAPVGGPPAAHIYCIPLADSSGQFTEIWVSPDGSFVSQGLAPGAYRLLAFDREQPELEYRNPEAMQAYDSKGPVVRVAGGQKERVTLQLISTSNSVSEQ